MFSLAVCFFLLFTAAIVTGDDGCDPADIHKLLPPPGAAPEAVPQGSQRIWNRPFYQPVPTKQEHATAPKKFVFNTSSS
jgi:hypothetical protein